MKHATTHIFLHLNLPPQTTRNPSTSLQKPICAPDLHPPPTHTHRSAQYFSIAFRQLVWPPTTNLTNVGEWSKTKPSMESPNVVLFLSFILRFFVYVLVRWYGCMSVCICVSEINVTQTESRPFDCWLFGFGVWNCCSMRKYQLKCFRISDSKGGEVAKGIFANSSLGWESGEGERHSRFYMYQNV